MKDFDFNNDRLLYKIAKIKSGTISLGLLRLIAFFATGGFLILFLSDSAWWLIPSFIAGSLFIILIKRFNHLKDQEKIFQSIIKIDENEVLRKKRDLSSLDSGEEYLDKLHPFANDLDLFGAHSLFQLINHTSSETAKEKLSSQLKSSFQFPTADQKREAVDELSNKIEFLRAFEAVGMSFFDKNIPQNQWEKWLEKEEKGHSWMLFAGIMGILGGTILFFLSYSGLIPFGYLGLWVLMGIGMLSFVFQPLKEAADKLPSKQTLKAFRNWLVLLEKENFNSSELVESIQKLKDQNLKASEKLQGLDRLGYWIENRLNILYIPVNLILWTDLILYYRLTRWKKKFGSSVSHIPDVLSDWEVWTSLGAFQKEVGMKGEVELSEELCLEVKNLNHPLLKPEKAISNSFSIDKDSKLTLLTGANMSGKTTFLRTLGTNLVLINLGLRPFGDSVKLGQFQLFTSMRNSDNLGESVSSFYAELSRIKSLIDRLDNGERIFFLLDEILKGTNTEDRVSGSEALIRQLSDSPSLGIISTHDIELSQLEEKIPYVRNYSFHSEIHEKTIDFDYKIKRGPCPNFNAHKLMELMGIRFQVN